MLLIILLFVLIFFIISPVFRCLIFNFPKYLYHKLISFYDYIYYREWNNPPFNALTTVVGASNMCTGSGKTLYASNHIQNMYKRYNNKKQRDKKTNKLFTNKIMVMSNIKLYDVEYIDFKGFEQIRQFAELKEQLEKDNPDIRYYLYVLVDEASVLLNSSQWKSKDNPLSLNALFDLVQTRHLQIQEICFTSQRFEMVDVNVRRLSNYVKTCQLVDLPLLNKKRFLILRTYIARDLEECTSELMIKPIRTECVYINNKKGFRYGNYNTCELAGKIFKKLDENDYLSDDDFSKTLENNNHTGVNTLRQTRKYKKSKK